MEAGSNARHIRKATMKVEQLSIFLENKAGRLAQVTKTLRKRESISEPSLWPIRPISAFSVSS